MGHFLGPYRPLISDQSGSSFPFQASFLPRRLFPYLFQDYLHVFCYTSGKCSSDWDFLTIPTVVLVGGLVSFIFFAGSPTLSAME